MPYVGHPHNTLTHEGGWSLTRVASVVLTTIRRIPSSTSVFTHAWA
mgnify:CR=1 FL=1